MGGFGDSIRFEADGGGWNGADSAFGAGKADREAGAFAGAAGTLNGAAVGADDAADNH